MVEETVSLTPRATKTKTRIAGLLVIAALAAILIAGVLPRIQRKAVLSNDAHGLATELLAVHVVEVKAGESKSDLTLPGSMQAIVEAPIYARMSGYIKKRFVDIGDKVRTGEVLAAIDAPEVDQELLQARATAAHSRSALGQTKASLVEGEAKMKLAKATLDRWVTLSARGVVSLQEKDQKQSDYDSAAAQVEALRSSVGAAEADVTAQDANVRRLEDMTSFKEVRAPFDGVITARHVDVGNLINEGSDSSQQELYHMARTDELRIMVGVPQAYAPLIHVGSAATVRVGEFGQKDFPGKIVRTADSLDPNSRTLLTEIHIPNREQLLFPGMFSSVRFRLDQKAPSLLVPGDVLLFDSNGTRAAVVNATKVVHFVPVTLGRDFGSSVEVLSGLQAGQHVIVNPTDTLTEGIKVDVLTK